jgi:hypothetical protein
MFMIGSFFQHLEQSGAKSLLISGQATILYGAATFSEDIDLWVEPSQANLDRLLQALRTIEARYYKLTPRLTSANAVRHHGFHFVIPEGDSEVFIDVMGSPPRVKSFDEAFRESRSFETPWGRLQTVGIRDLVELKKTQRARDYPIISRLALAWLDERGGGSLDTADFTWLFENIFSLPELIRLFEDYPGLALSASSSMPSLCLETARQIAEQGYLEALLEDQIESWMDERILPLRRADRHFWRPVIEELRQMRLQGELEIEGDLV